MSATFGLSGQTNLRAMKQQMCEIGRRIWHKGFCAGNEGNHSLRLPPHNGQARFLCTPTGISKGFLEPEDICLIDEQANLVEPNARGRKPSSEVKVHLAIYRHRPDVQAVIHSHPPHATAFAVAGIPLPESIHPEAEVFLGKVKYAPYAAPSTEALPQSLLPLIDADTTTVLMGNHGTVSFSSNDLTDTYYKLEILDAYARILLLSKQLGRVNLLSQEQMVDLLNIKKNFGLDDSRLTCAADGCIGEDNQPFLASFDVRPASATCSCDGGAVQHRHSQPTEPASAPNTDPVFEQMVQTITDQIMSARR